MLIFNYYVANVAILNLENGEDITMKINQLIANNINKLDAVLPVDKSLGIAGLSGSGKTTFCQTIGEESKKRLVSLLPKAEYQYLFPNIMETNFSAIKMEEMPLVLFLGKSSISSNPRSTIGTHTGVFKEIRVRLLKNLIFLQKFFHLIMH